MILFSIYGIVVIQKLLGQEEEGEKSLSRWPNRLRLPLYSTETFAGSNPPFDSMEWRKRVALSGHTCASLHVGYARQSRPVLNYRNTFQSPDLNRGG